MSLFERFIPVFTGDRRYVSVFAQEKIPELREFPAGTNLEVVNGLRDFFSRDARLVVTRQDLLDFVKGRRGRKGSGDVCVLRKNAFTSLPRERRFLDDISDEVIDLFLDSHRAESIRDAAFAALSTDDWRKIPRNPFRRSDDLDRAVELSMLSDLFSSGITAPGRPTRWTSPFFPFDFYRDADGKIDVNRFVSRNHPEYLELLQRAVKRLFSRVLV